jgi:hypothetical protein
MKRRRVLHAGLALAASPLALATKGSARADPPPAPKKAAYERVVTRVGQNHGHVFEVSLADVTAGVAKTYDLTGTSGHPHSVTLDAGVFERLKAGEIVRLPSTRTGHLHRLLVRLGPLVDPPEAANVCTVQIAGKDDHDLVITAADLQAHADKTYDIQGVAGHTHSVRIVAADFERLARGEQLAISSSYASPGEDHFHVVFIRYPGRK